MGKTTFCGFSMGSKLYWAGRVFGFVCVFYDGSTRRLAESGFMEKLGIEPVTPGLQGIRLSPTPWRQWVRLGAFLVISTTVVVANIDFNIDTGVM